MTCVVCGNEIEKSCYINKVLCSGKCFLENFWNECLDDEAIIIDGKCFHDGGKTECDKGFGGKRFKIKMSDGRIIETDNLRYNGTVPKERKIKDNARFL